MYGSLVISVEGHFLTVARFVIFLAASFPFLTLRNVRYSSHLGDLDSGMASVEWWFAFPIGEADPLSVDPVASGATWYAVFKADMPAFIRICAARGFSRLMICRKLHLRPVSDYPLVKRALGG